MNKTAIKSFAVWARHRLIEAAKQKAAEYGITEAGTVNAPLRIAPEQLRPLLDEIHRKGYEQVMEEAAALWFDRLIVFRFAQVNGFVPAGMESVDPGCFTEVMNWSLPGKLPDWAELLLRDELLRPEGVPRRMAADIPARAFADRVQIIGWLYQYYNSERKDDVFAQLKKNVKITKERLPLATQLFTPEWIVRYLVENSVGRLYVRYALEAAGQTMSETERVAAEARIAAAMGWRYYLPEAEQIFGQRLPSDAGFDPQKIKILDPCMGAGHILVCVFEVLMQIYRAMGWSEAAAAKSIIEHNLYGLDIDERVSRLSICAVLMKAGKYCRELLSGGIRPNVLAIRDSDFLTDDLIAAVAGSDEAVGGALCRLRSIFRNASEFGSLLNVPQLDLTALYERIGSAECLRHEKERLLSLVRQAQLLGGQFDVVVTNPPYMGAGSMSDPLSRFVKAHYPDSKSDLFAVFMDRCPGMLKSGGYLAMVTQHSWMFLKSFGKLRQKLLSFDMVGLVHLGARAFAEIPGDVVQTVGFVLRSTHTEGYRGTYCRLTTPATQQGKESLFLSGEGRFFVAQENFSRLPGCPIAYWLSPDLMLVFANDQTVGTVADSKQGIATARNSRYLRLWHECTADSIFDGCTSHEQSARDERRWYPYNKGGGKRKWYGQPDYLIDWCRDGAALRCDKKAVLRNMSCFFKECVSWSLVCTGLPAFRFVPEGKLFDVAGMCCFSDAYLDYLLALLNSKVAFEMLKVLSPTINYQCGDIAGIPVRIDPGRQEKVEKLARSNVELCREDWDSFEVSRHFKTHPLI